MFKAGDRVRRVKDSHFCMAVNDIATVKSTDIPGHVELIEFGGQHSVNCLEHAHASPIRTVTRREIVPGAYGQVSVFEADRGRVEIFIDATSTADQLREAAHLFNQLAEALEDKP